MTKTESFCFPLSNFKVFLFVSPVFLLSNSFPIQLFSKGRGKRDCVMKKGPLPEMDCFFLVLDQLDFFSYSRNCNHFKYSNTHNSLQIKVNNWTEISFWSLNGCHVFLHNNSCFCNMVGKIFWYFFIANLK